MVDQSLFDCPVSCQDYHLLKSKVDCEHWSIFFGQLKGWRQAKVRLTVLYNKYHVLTYTETIFAYTSNRATKMKMNCNGRINVSDKQNISHIEKRVVQSVEIHMKQVTKQGKRFRSWRLPLLVSGAQTGVKEMEDQQAHNGRQQGD